MLLLLFRIVSALGQVGNPTPRTPANPISIRKPQFVQPVRVDKQPTLVYELHITNEAGVRLTIRDLYLLQKNKRRSDTLLHYDEATLSHRLAPLPGNNKVQGASIPPGASSILYIEVSSSELRTPGLQHLLRYQLDGSDAVDVILYNDLLRWQLVEPVLLSPPLRGGNWTAIYDPSWTRGHRRVVYTTDGAPHIPGRLAIDFMKVDSIQYARQEDSIVTWFGYGAEVLAVADCEVASVCDSFPESATLAAHPAYTAAQATGNYISLKIAPDRYVFYEHLQPGSIAVKPGQRIQKGAVIARLGFTGQTTGPHLHFHVADRNSPLGAEGVPFEFDRFTQIGHYPDFSQFGKVTFTRIAAKNVQRAMPASNTVVVFE